MKAEKEGYAQEEPTRLRTPVPSRRKTSLSQSLVLVKW